ncbi:MAG: DnaJ domain-containing protein [Halobacteriales archaeon]|nr:DnaJ domain-containing protein [Halobacteriales archaeon]
MADREPHDVLGVARDASEDEVRDAYRQMVKKHHPDVSDAEDAEERFVRIRDAYEVMRERAEQRGATGNGQETRDAGTGAETRTQTSAQTQSEHKRRKREKRKRWEDPWKEDTENEEENGREKEPEKVDTIGYGWSLFREDGRFFVSKSGGRGNVYIDREGRSNREKTSFSSAEAAEEAYERHVDRREEQRRNVSLGNGWRMVENAGGYAVEGEEGYIGFDGKLQSLPYWFTSREDAKSAHESYVRRDTDTDTVVSEEDDSLASRVTVGAALLPFLVTVTVLNVLSSSLGLGTKGKNPYISTALTSVLLGFSAFVVSAYNTYLSFILLFFAVWAGIEFVVMIAGPYTADEMNR